MAFRELVNMARLKKGLLFARREQFQAALHCFRATERDIGTSEDLNLKWLSFEAIFYQADIFFILGNQIGSDRVLDDIVLRYANENAPELAVAKAFAQGQCCIIQCIELGDGVPVDIFDEALDLCRNAEHRFLAGTYASLLFLKGLLLLMRSDEEAAIATFDEATAQFGGENGFAIRALVADRMRAILLVEPQQNSGDVAMFEDAVERFLGFSGIVMAPKNQET